MSADNNKRNDDDDDDDDIDSRWRHSRLVPGRQSSAGS